MRVAVRVVARRPPGAAAISRGKRAACGSLLRCDENRSSGLSARYHRSAGRPTSPRPSPRPGWRGPGPAQREGEVGVRPPRDRLRGKRSATRLLELPHLGDRVLEEAGVFVDGLIVLVPADILAAVFGTRLIDGAFAVAVEKLAGFEVLLDQLLALAGDLNAVALLELAHGEAEELGKPADVLPADLDIPGHTATEARTFAAVERSVLTILSHHQPRADRRGHSAPSAPQLSLALS